MRTGLAGGNAPGFMKSNTSGDRKSQSDERGSEASSLAVNAVKPDTTEDRENEYLEGIKAVGRMKRRGLHRDTQSDGIHREADSESYQLTGARFRSFARRIFCGKQAPNRVLSPEHSKEHERTRAHRRGKVGTIESFYGSCEAQSAEKGGECGVIGVSHRLADFLAHRFCVPRLHYGDRVHGAPLKWNLRAGRLCAGNLVISLGLRYCAAGR